MIILYRDNEVWTLVRDAEVYEFFRDNESWTLTNQEE